MSLCGPSFPPLSRDNLVDGVTSSVQKMYALFTESNFSDRVISFVAVSRGHGVALDSIHFRYVPLTSFPILPMISSVSRCRLAPELETTAAGIEFSLATS